LDPPSALTGQDIPYERVAGRAWGELDPSDPKNALITDIGLAPKKANGNVEYIASFFIVKPVDMSQASGVMWHDVPNRGGRITITADLRNLHDVGLSSGWQGDNAGATAVPANAADIPGTPPFGTNEWVKVPVLTGVTGRIFGRIINRSGLGAQPLNEKLAAATPMYGALQRAADLRPYLAKPARVPVDEMNDPAAPAAGASALLNLGEADRVPDIAGNEILWKAERGEDCPMPPPVRAAFVKPLPDD